MIPTIIIKKDSYFEDIKSFPYNTEIEMALHFKGKKGKFIYTLPSSSSVLYVCLKSSSLSPGKPTIISTPIQIFGK